MKAAREDYKANYEWGESILLGIPQSKISCLVNGKLSMFSLDHLLVLLNKLDRNVDIIIKPKTKEERVGSTHVLLVA